MIHYSCDRCKRVLDAKEDLRYVVKLEVQAAMDADLDEGDFDQDHLMEIHDMLERLDDCDNELIGEDVYQRQRYDLCADCYRKFIQNPVGCETPAQLGFSQN